MITFADIPVLLEDPDGRIAQFVEHFLSFADLNLFGDRPISLSSNRPQSRSGQKAFRGLPLPNYPAPPRFKLNAFYWPTGAARWARAHFLISGEILDQLKPLVADSTPQQLVMRDDGTDFSVVTDMYALSARPISVPDVQRGPNGQISSKEELWLLTLVDERYFWQFRNVGDLNVGTSTTWASLLSTLGTNSGITIDADYLNPDPREFNRNYENAALLIDAIAHSTGRRFVRKLDGTNRLINWTNSETVYSQNINERQWRQTAGGQFTSTLAAAMMPETIAVTFPKWRDFVGDPDGEVFAVEIDSADANPAADSSFGTTPGMVKTIHSTCFADATGDAGPPVNDEELQALAKIIAGDFYQQFAKRFDYSFVSLLAWNPTGWDDAVEWVLGRRLPDGSYLAGTRVWSVPANFGVEEQLQQDPEKTLREDSETGGGNATAGPCTEVICASPGSSLSPWEVCTCGPALIGFSFSGTLTDDSGSLTGQWYLEFQSADSDPTTGIWKTPNIIRGDRTFFFRLIGTAGTATLRLIETVDSSEVILAAWTGTFCCCCAFSVNWVCVDATDPTTGVLPLPLTDMPRTLCLSPAGEGSGTIETVNVNCPGAMTVARTWYADLPELTWTGGEGCNEAAFGTAGACQYGRLVVHHSTNCLWSGHVHNPPAPCDAGTTWNLWIDSTHVRMAPVWEFFGEAGSWGIEYSIPIGDFDPLGENELTPTISSGGLAACFTGWADPLILRPGKFVVNGDDTPFLVPEGDCTNGSCGGEPGPCTGTSCDFESVYDDLLGNWVWQGVENETPCDNETCFCSVESAASVELRDLRTNELYPASDFQGQIIEFDCITEEEIIYP
jgi:hypothetical protein